MSQIKKRFNIILIMGVFFSATSTQAAAKLLWDNWYTVTINGKTPYGYYNDRVESKDGKIAFKNQFWKKEEGFINEEQLVTLSTEKDLTPEIFNFRSLYRNEELHLDGTITQRSLSVKGRKGKEDLKPIKKQLGPKIFFSTVFPIYFKQQLPKLKENKPIMFSILMEDRYDQGYPSVPVTLKLEKQDVTAKELSTKKISVDIDGNRSIWFLKDSGEPIRIEFIQQKTVVVKTDESKARKFLISKENIPE